MFFYYIYSGTFDESISQMLLELWVYNIHRISLVHKYVNILKQLQKVDEAWLHFTKLLLIFPP